MVAMDTYCSPHSFPNAEPEVGDSAAFQVCMVATLKNEAILVIYSLIEMMVPTLGVFSWVRKFVITCDSSVAVRAGPCFEESDNTLC